MDPNELFALKNVARGDFGLLGGYDVELERLRAAGLVGVGGKTKWLLTDAGRIALQAEQAKGTK